jgi:DNA-binding SARP family transcriptional activator
MQYGILGPLAVWEDGREVALGAAKQRAVLAVLLLRANEPVPPARLIDALWGEQPPATAGKIVQGYVSRLRKELGEGAIETSPAGYRLRLEPDALDLRRFEVLLDEGRRRFEAGDARRAGDAFRDALALWRGPALADFAYEPFAADEIGRLEELRLVALEQRFEAELAQGRHAELVAELEVLVRAHPLRESLRRLLMLALYRADRQADALAVYQDARATLVEELGLAPSESLQRLEKAILLHDPSLEIASALPPAAESEPPRSLEAESQSPPDPGVRGNRLRSIAVDSPPRRRWPIIAPAFGALVAAFAGLALVGGVAGTAGTPPTLVKLDGAGRIVAEVHDEMLGCGPCGPNVWIVDGTLWVQSGADGRTMSIRSLTTGEVIRTIALSPTARGLTIGFGAVWVVEPGVVGAPPLGTVERIDGLSGRVAAKVPIHGDYLRNGTITTGDDAIWVLDQDGMLTRIDPASNRVSGRFDTGALETYVLATGAGYVWICECSPLNRTLLRYDTRTRTAKRYLIPKLPETWRRPVPVLQTFVIGEDARTRTLWFLDGDAGLVIPLDPRGRPAGPSIGLAGVGIQAAMANRRIWVASSTVVNRVSLVTGKRDTITLPLGMNATGIAVDRVTDVVWVGNSTALNAP